MSRQGGEGGDDLTVIDLPQLSIECKDWATFAPWTWIKQAEANTIGDGIGIVWFKQRGKAACEEGGLLIHARHLPRILQLLEFELDPQAHTRFFEDGSISQAHSPRSSLSLNYKSQSASTSETR